MSRHGSLSARDSAAASPALSCGSRGVRGSPSSSEPPGPESSSESNRLRRCLARRPRWGAPPLLPAGRWRGPEPVRRPTRILYRMSRLHPRCLVSVSIAYKPGLYLYYKTPKTDGGFRETYSDTSCVMRREVFRCRNSLINCAINCLISCTSGARSEYRYERAVQRNSTGR
jgi:hypothetical protein